MNEKEIIKRCQDGDKSAFDELIRTFYPYVGKYLLKLTGDKTLTEDLTQDVFLKVILWMNFTNCTRINFIKYQKLYI